jgi:hypothetical protein
LAFLWIAALALVACSSVQGDVPSAGGDGAAGSPPGAGDPGAPGSFDPSSPGSGTPPGGAPCTPSPANVEVPGNGCDDDGDGKIDEPPPTCDASLDVAADADAFARALGLCQRAGPVAWGVVSASYVNGFTRTTAPADGQHGILPGFGFAVAPREGASLGVLSTGWARAYDDGAAHTPFNSQPPNAMQVAPVAGLPGVVAPVHGEPPPGWPRAAAGCPALSTDTYDMAGVELVVKVPANATGLVFDFDFYSGEWPQWVCSTYNDGFVAMLQSKGAWQNVSFDKKGDPVSVNFAFFDRCTPGVKTSCKQSMPVTSVCAGGAGELAGTGFAIEDDYCGYGTTSTGGGATGWLESAAPVAPGETITLRLLVWDTGDYKFDSSVLVDHLHWIAAAPPPLAPSTDRAPPIH